ncbi:M4 family metallopeptidase [Longispora sp. NPDC051575]|uniref:M4 family metallopeptidase n=1 Tax=Longispora sp. NPDC051575 TaxID=3154943 RepID=UPI00341B6127
MRPTLLALTLAATALVVPAAPAVAGPAPDRPTRSAADRFVAHEPTRFHRGPEEQLRQIREYAGGNGLRYTSYERTYRGLPVLGGDAVVVTDAAGRVVHAAVAPGRPLDLPVTPTVSTGSALATARTKLDAVGEATEPTLAVLASEAGPRLVWDTVVTGRSGPAPSRQRVLVDARTGAVARSYDEVRAGTASTYYNGSRTIGTTGSGGTFRMADPARPGLECGNVDGVVYTGPDDTWGNGSGTDLETACADVLYAGAKESDMVSAWLGRSGLDGQGHGFAARVGGDYANAYWTGTFATFGRAVDLQRQATSLDIVGHEFGHGIYQHSPGGLNDEPGLDEGYADIFGTLTEHYANDPTRPADYLVGEDVNLYGNGPLRSQSRPSDYYGPDCWSTDLPGAEAHFAAGPLNHFFYLLAEGSTPTNGRPASPICAGGPPSVTPIGLQEAGKVLYNGLLAKTSSWRYADVRVATLAAAKNLYPSGCVNFNRVRDAWNAVAVPAGPHEPTCGTTDDFTLAVDPATASVKQDGGVTTWVSTGVATGSTNLVSLSFSGLPAGTTGVLTSNRVPTGYGTELFIDTDATTPVGSYPVTVTGVGGATRTTTFTLVVTLNFDDYAFTVTDVPEFVVPGDAADLKVNAIKDSGSANQYVTLGISGLPAGVSATFDPPVVPTGGIVWQPGILHLTTTTGTAHGDYRVTVTGDGTVADHQTAFTLAVRPRPNEFSLAVAPAALSVPAGTTGTLTVSTALVSGAVPSIALTSGPGGLPAGTTRSFSPATVAAGGSSTLSVTVPAGATPGSGYSITVLGTANGRQHQVVVPVTVTPGGFCAGYQNTLTGTLASGASVYRPGTAGFTAAAGVQRGCVDGPAGADFDLYLQKWNGSTWVNVASGTSPGADETLTYTGTAGTYRYRVLSYSGAGNYTLGYSVP